MFGHDVSALALALVPPGNMVCHTFFSHSLHLSLRLQDGVIRIINYYFFATMFPTTLYGSARIRTHVSRVAPTWDLLKDALPPKLMLNGGRINISLLQI